MTVPVERIAVLGLGEVGLIAADGRLQRIEYFAG
jgi:hypothetical protein